MLTLQYFELILIRFYVRIRLKLEDESDNTDLCEVLMLDDWLEPIECTCVYVHVCVCALLNTKRPAVYD